VKIRTSPVTTDVMTQHFARNRETLETLARLGVGDGVELALAFAYRTAGPRADHELAAFLRRETAYEIEVELEGVSGTTTPMPVTRTELDDWVWKMVVLGHDHGGCLFDGWTATVAAGGQRRHGGMTRAQARQPLGGTTPRPQVLAYPRS
jgi:hypothetical protein